MRFSFFSTLIFLLFSIAVSANEEKAEADHVQTEFSGRQTQEWSDVQTKLGALKGKVDAQDAVVKGLIAEKSHLTGKELSEKMEQLKKEHLKWQNLVNDFNRLNSEFETKFPEKGLKENRIYKRIDPRSIDKIETDMSFDARLEKVRKKVTQQYPKTAQQIESENKSKKSPKKAPLKKPEPSQVKSKDDVTEQIILQK